MSYRATTTLTRSGRVATYLIDDETCLIDLQTGDAYFLDGTGGAIWELLEEPITVGELVGRLAELYATPAERISRDLGGYLDTLVSRGAITTR